MLSAHVPHLEKLKLSKKWLWVIMCFSFIDHLSVPDNILVDRLNLQEETDIIENTKTLNRRYNINIVSLTNDTKKYIGHSEYLDGSKIDHKTGAGVIIYKKKDIIYRQSYSLPSRASIFQAELEASFFNRNKARYPAKYIKILVDSLLSAFWAEQFANFHN